MFPVEIVHEILEYLPASTVAAVFDPNKEPEWHQFQVGSYDLAVEWTTGDDARVRKLYFSIPAFVDSLQAPPYVNLHQIELKICTLPVLQQLFGFPWLTHQMHVSLHISDAQNSIADWNRALQSAPPLNFQEITVEYAYGPYPVLVALAAKFIYIPTCRTSDNRYVKYQGGDRIEFEGTKKLRIPYLLRESIPMGVEELEVFDVVTEKIDLNQYRKYRRLRKLKLTCDNFDTYFILNFDISCLTGLETLEVVANKIFKDIGDYSEDIDSVNLDDLTSYKFPSSLKVLRLDGFNEGLPLYFPESLEILQINGLNYLDVNLKSIKKFQVSPISPKSVLKLELPHENSLVSLQMHRWFIDTYTANFLKLGRVRHLTIKHYETTHMENLRLPINCETLVLENTNLANNIVNSKLTKVTAKDSIVSMQNKRPYIKLHSEYTKDVTPEFCQFLEDFQLEDLKLKTKSPLPPQLTNCRTLKSLCIETSQFLDSAWDMPKLKWLQIESCDFSILFINNLPPVQQLQIVGGLVWGAGVVDFKNTSLQFLKVKLEAWRKTILPPGLKILVCTDGKLFDGACDVIEVAPLDRQ